ncbi:MAG: hypothetical protein IJT34_09315 [Butyrivibrio sp.]|nr:hypothetical protein [Butyrivibrio sp.]
MAKGLGSGFRAENRNVLGNSLEGNELILTSRRQRHLTGFVAGAAVARLRTLEDHDQVPVEAVRLVIAAGCAIVDVPHGIQQMPEKKLVRKLVILVCGGSVQDIEPQTVPGIRGIRWRGIRTCVFRPVLLEICGYEGHLECVFHDPC